MITPLIDLVKLDYNRIPNQDTLNPGIELITEINKPIYIKNSKMMESQKKSSFLHSI